LKLISKTLLTLEVAGPGPARTITLFTGGADIATGDGVDEGFWSPKQAIALASAAATFRGETMIGARFCSTSFRFSSDKDVSTRKEKVFSKSSCF
jgi:hypothetical protein